MLQYRHKVANAQIEFTKRAINTFSNMYSTTRIVKCTGGCKLQRASAAEFKTIQARQGDGDLPLNSVVSAISTLPAPLLTCPCWWRTCPDLGVWERGTYLVHTSTQAPSNVPLHPLPTTYVRDIVGNWELHRFLIIYVHVIVSIQWSCTTASLEDHATKPFKKRWILFIM